MASRTLAGAAVAVLGTTIAAVNANADPRLAPPGCVTVEVQAGDNAWTIGQHAGITLDVLAKNNPQIPNLSLIHPGDHLALSCPGPKNTPADPTLPAPIIVQSVNEVQQRAGEPWEGMAPWPGFNKWLPGDGVNGVASQAAVLKALYAHGARGDQLIGLAAITENESNRRIGAIGDTTITDGTYGPSFGVFQVRSMVAQDHTGGPRDRYALEGDLDHQAWAAVEVYQAAAAKGRDPLSPWTAHLKGHDRSFLAPYRELAQRMGLL